MNFRINKKASGKTLHKLNIKFLLLFICFSFGLSAQQKTEITGTVFDSYGNPLPGANVVVVGTERGVLTNFDGQFEIKAAAGEVLSFSLIGMKGQKVTITGEQVYKIVLEDDVLALEAVEITGIRGAISRATKIKSEAASVVEAIAPEDIGNYSDDNIVDALSRVAGVQVERDNSGTEGDRVSLRGVGPQFVNVTINGRQPLSAGSEGITNFRQFNLGVLPPEVTSGALIYKTPVANVVEPGIGGLVDFQILKPLAKNNYKGDSQFFGAVNLRAEYDTNQETFQPKPRISAIFGGKTKDGKLGAYVSVLASDVIRVRDEQFVRVKTGVDIKVDNNKDGIFDEADGDVLHTNLTVPDKTEMNPIEENQKRLGFVGAIEWKPTENLTILADATYANYDKDSYRNLFRPNYGAGATNGVFGNKNIFQPEAIQIDNGFVSYFNTAGSKNSRVNTQIQNRLYNSGTENLISGLNAVWEKDTWKINADVSYSGLDYLNVLRQNGRVTSSWRDVDQSNIVFDARNVDVPYVSFGEQGNQDISNLDNFNFNTSFNREVQVLGRNIATRLDVSKELNENVSIDFGTRYNASELDSREATGLIPYTSEQEQAIRDGYDGSFTNPFFPEYNSGYNQWIEMDADLIESLTPEIHQMTGGTAFEGDIFDAESSEGDLPFVKSKSFNLQENTTAIYGQLNIKGKIGNLPFSGNVGLRALNTAIHVRGFSGVVVVDPMGNIPSDIQDAAQSSVKNDRWDYLPSLNINLELSEDFHFRLSASKAISQPKIVDLRPNNDIRSINSNSSIFDPSSPDYVGEDLTDPSVPRGEITSGNPELKPYSAIQFDGTFEYYTSAGGSFIASGFYKEIFDFIAMQSEQDQLYDPALYGVELPADAHPDILYDVIKPVNFSDAILYGFELGFNQPFTFFPGVFKSMGLQGNWTHVESDFEKEIGDFGGGFPGTSKNSFTGIFYYDKDGLGARVAYTYRTDYLRNLGAGGTTRRANTIYSNAFGQLDARISYAILKRKLQFSLGVSNVMGEGRRQYIGEPENFYGFTSRGVNYKLGIRYKF